jgi:hypothetical protein
MAAALLTVAAPFHKVPERLAEIRADCLAMQNDVQILGSTELQARIFHSTCRGLCRRSGLLRGAPQHFLYFRPDPHGQGSFRPILTFDAAPVRSAVTNRLPIFFTTASRRAKRATKFGCRFWNAAQSCSRR